MSKKNKKQNLENSQGENSENRILQIIKKHSEEITKTKIRFLKDGDSDQYQTYANIEAAFDILIDELEEEGLWHEQTSASSDD